MSLLTPSTVFGTIIALVENKPLPHSYFVGITPMLAWYMLPKALWSLVAGFIIVAWNTAIQLGRNFLKGIRNLPSLLSIQKVLFMLLEVVCIFTWCGIILWMVLGLILGALWYQSSDFFIWTIDSFWAWWIGGSIIGGVIGYFAKRWIARNIESYYSQKIDKKKGALTIDALSDIRKVYETVQNAIDFDPENDFKKDYIAVGRDDKKKPIYISLETFKRTHIQVMGCTGSGKGVACAVMLYQALLQGIAVVVLEPKKHGDEWAPHVLAKAAKAADKNFWLIDLQHDTAQINLLNNITQDELDELLQAGMGIEDKGADGDYYRIKDRKAARETSLLAGEAKSIPHLEALVHEIAPETMEEADSYSDKLEILAQVKAVQTEEGVELKKALDNGDCIYIIGSTRRPQYKLLQKMVLLRILQIIERRSRMEKHRHVSIFVDETKYFLTRPVLDALATVRDHDCNLVLAHQAPGDLLDVTKDINPQAAFAGVINNTNIKLIYKLNDDQDQHKSAKLTGTITVQRESKELLTNIGMGEVIASDRRHVMTAEQDLYSHNVFAALEPRVGVLIGNGVAKLCFTSPIKVEKSHLEIVSYPISKGYPKNKGDVSDIGKNNPKFSHSSNTKTSYKNAGSNDEFESFFDQKNIKEEAQ